MIVILNNGSTYLVKWSHRPPEKIKSINIKYIGYPNYPDRGGTSCSIFQLTPDDKRLVSKADLLRYYRDPYCKEKGRYYSFTAALKVFNKQDRSVFWNTYLGRSTKGISNSMGRCKGESG